MAHTQPDFDALIIAAGPTGLSLVCSLAARNLRVGVSASG